MYKGSIGAGNIHLQKIDFLEKPLSYGLETNVRGPKARYEYVKKFRVIKIPPNV
jgi:hypothetical protein